MLDPDTYPAARPKRIGGGEALNVALAPLPRSRVFSFVESATGTSRRTVSAPRCQGPALLKDFSWYISTHNTGAQLTIEIGYALVPVTEAGVALATIRPYTVMTELVDPFAVASASAGVGLVDSTQPSTNVRWKEPLDLIIEANEFYPVVAYVNAAATAQFVHGNLRVVEGILRSALEQYY